MISLLLALSSINLNIATLSDLQALAVPEACRLEILHHRRSYGGWESIAEVAETVPCAIPVLNQITLLGKHSN